MFSSMSKISIQYYTTPLGELVLGSYGKHLCLCDWNNRQERHSIYRRLNQGLDSSFKEEPTAIIDEAIVEIANFLEGNNRDFLSSVKLIGTEFQIRVWTELKNLSYGETVSYSELSRRIEKPKAVRAVAAAVGANALSLFIPCHRVVGEDGSLTGYAGGIEAKRSLLNLENDVIGQQYQLFQ